MLRPGVHVLVVGLVACSNAGGGAGSQRFGADGSAITGPGGFWVADATDGGGVLSPSGDLAQPVDVASAMTDTSVATTDPGQLPTDVAAPVDLTAPPVDAKPWDYLLPPCGDEKVVLSGTLEQATVLLVMDRSASMKGQKWLDAQAAVKGTLDAYASAIRFGLLLYPQETGECAVFGSPDVDFALSNGDKIASAMAAAALKGGTPTGAAINAAHAVLNVISGKRIVILATDGKPTCITDCTSCTAVAAGGCVGGSCSLCTNKTTCTQSIMASAVAALKSDDVSTYVIGIAGSGSAATTLNAMAVAGGTALPGTTKYYAPATADELTQAFADIAGQVASCSQKLTPTAGFVSLVLEIDGKKVTKDPTHQDGWDLLPGHVLQLYGSACAQATAAGADVSVTYVCKYADK